MTHTGTTTPYNNGTCTACPAGQSSAPGSASGGCTACPAGLSSIPGGNCTACAFGFSSYPGEWGGACGQILLNLCGITRAGGNISLNCMACDYLPTSAHPLVTGGPCQATTSTLLPGGTVNTTSFLVSTNQLYKASIQADGGRLGHTGMSAEI